MADRPLEFPQTPLDGATGDEPTVVGFELIIKLLCTKCHNGHVIVCLGKDHGAVCPSCQTEYFLSFLYWNPDDPQTHTAPDGSARMGLTISQRKRSKIVPARHIPPTPIPRM
jgi:hypothetical protein